MKARRLGAGCAVGLVVLVLASAAPAEAQRYGREMRFDERSDPRLFLDLGFVAGDPVGEFSQFVDDGWGLGTGLAWAVDPAGLFRVRVGGGFLVYGHERQEVCISDRLGCRVLADLTTTNSILYADLGAELGVDLGAVRPYVGVGRGLSYFVTSSSLNGPDDYDGLFDTTNFDDLVWGWRSRAGLQLQVSHGRTPVYLDLSANYHENGRAEYLTEGDIVDNPDGSITLYPVLSEANLVTFQVGVSIGLGGGDDGPRRERRRRPRRHR
ncbi:MAG: hypothetical protein R3E98_18590 [Gemmatimonadota bacterium]|nr:hypothetical protein [Gemmatimonadota bacterium]